MSKVYKGRQKLNFEQAGQYYSHAYKIGVEHGRFVERQRIIKLLEEYVVAKHWYTVSNLQAVSKFRTYMVDQIEGEQE